MYLANLNPNSTALSCLVCSSGADFLRWGMGSHGLIVKFGLDSIVYVAILLLLCNLSLEGLEDSKFLFLEMSDRDLISWLSVMASSIQNGHHGDALELWLRC